MKEMEKEVNADLKKALSYIINSVLKTLENKYHNKTTFCRINIDQNKEISEKYGVYEIPTILFFKNGKVIDSLLGISPKYVIESKLSELIHINN